MTATSQAPAAGTATVGAKRRSHNYFDEQGIRRRSHVPVPVNEFGQLAGRLWECKGCKRKGTRTEPHLTALNTKGIPVCELCDQRMTPVSLKRPPLLPYRALWDVCEKPLRPVWGGLTLALAGMAVDAGHIPVLAVAGAVPLSFEVGRRWWRGRRVKAELKANRLEKGDDLYGKKIREAIDKASRTVGYSSAAGLSWLTLIAGIGLDPSTTGGKLAWSLLPLFWIGPAATYWKVLRDARKPKDAPVVEPDGPAGPETDEQRVMRIWTTGIGAHVGDIVGTATDKVTKIKATQAGRLAGTQLENWSEIRGGWSATIVGPPGVFESDNYLQARGKIAGAYSVSKPMVSLVPDAEDENRCQLLVQKTAVIGEDVPWSGPDSVNAETGLAPLVRYVDGTLGMYELYRPGWGCPHELYIGTTGAAKSSALEQVFSIDRWAHYTGPDGVKRGIIADFLIDPQQGQSFGAFVDDLAAPVASTIDEAMMLVRAFRREMLRRNKYLSRKPWTDARNRPRRGAKWWNPLEDGTMLFLTIDEAHEFLAIREFAALITAGARMYRKCGMKIRVATHTPLLSDLGGSMALRDMLTGGFVWCGRTANGLSGPTAFNGRLPADPKSIPEVPGAAYILSAIEKKPMLARTMWERDYYDYVRDADNERIGYPGVLSAETLAAFGEEYADWLQFMASEGAEEGLWTPEQDEAQPVKVEQSSDPSVREYLTEMVMWALTSSDEPLDMDGLDAVLRRAEVQASTLSVRNVLAELRGQGHVVTRGSRHELSPKTRASLDAQMAEAWKQVEGYAEQDAA